MNLRDFIPILGLDLVLDEKKTKLETIFVDRLFHTIWRTFIPPMTFSTFRKSQQAKEEFANIM